MVALDDVAETLTQDVGPFPVWGWAVIIVGGVGAGLALSRALGSGSGSGGPAPGDGSAGSLLPSGSGTVGGAVGLPFTVAAPDPLDGYTNNTDWRRAALNALVATGNFDALTVDRALGRYLQGYALTADDEAVIEEALRAVGLPPDPPLALPRVIDPPTPPPTPTPTPTPAPAPNPQGPGGPSTPAPAPAPTPTPAPNPQGPGGPSTPAPAPTPAPNPQGPGGRFPSVRPLPTQYRSRPGDTWRSLDSAAGMTPGVTLAFNRFLRQPGQVIPNPLTPGFLLLIPPTG